MEHPLSATETSIPVRYSCFGLLTAAGDLSDLVEIEPEPELASAADHGLGLFSAGNDHTAAIRVEYWDAAPPAPDSNPAGGRPVAAEFTVRIGDGPLLLQGMEVSEYEELDPPPFSGPARARVTCTGREEAHRLTYEEIELFYEGVERWVVQIWPDAAGQAPSGGDTV